MQKEASGELSRRAEGVSVARGGGCLHSNCSANAHDVKSSSQDSCVLLRKGRGSRELKRSVDAAPSRTAGGFESAESWDKVPGADD